MTFTQFVAVATLLGVGGAMGALVALITAASKVRDDFSGFRELFRTYIAPKSDGDSLNLKSSFAQFESDLTGLTAAYDRAKLALKLR